ncbi:MAG: GNAT family N-acetyltransferase [Candidatus Bipolaricaulaceae bacterium]
MTNIHVEEVREEMAEDLAWLCVPKEKRAEPAFVKGVEAKLAWIRNRLREGRPFCKIAYMENEPAGLLQYEIVPELSLARILCIFVPEMRFWGKGIGTELLSSLVEEMRKIKGAEGQPLQALLVHTFPGESEGQLSAREFFLRRSFRQVTEDPDLLVLPLVPSYRFQPEHRFETFPAPPPYWPQPEDRNAILIIYGPFFCPWSVFWYAKAAEILKGVIPQAPLRWIDGVHQREELEKRGGFQGIVVNGHPLGHSVFDGEAFVDEAQKAWKKGG